MGDSASGQGTPGTPAPPSLSVRSMVAAVAVLGAKLSKSQVDRDYQEGAPRHSARAFLAWRAAYRELGRTADSRIDRSQTSAPIPPASERGAPPERAGALGAAAGSSVDPAATPEPPAAADAEDDAPAVDEHSQAYRQDRARNERIKAERAQIELDQLRGALVPLREVEDFEFTAGRIVRDRVEMVPARVSADLHALVLSLIPEEHRAAVGIALELHVFERRLADALREALTEAAKTIEEARRDDDDPD